MDCAIATGYGGFIGGFANTLNFNKALITIKQDDAE